MAVDNDSLLSGELPDDVLLNKAATIERCIHRACNRQ